MEHGARRSHPLAQLARTALVLIICAAALAALAASRTAGTSTPSSSVGGQPTSRLADAPITIQTLSAAGIICPSGASFTSDSSAFAVIGPTSNCPLSSGVGSSLNHKLAIFDTTSDTVTMTISLDPLVLASGLTSDAQDAVQAIRYAGLGWSPDGSSYAVAYIALDDPTGFSLDDTLGSGLLLVNRNGGAARVIHGSAGFFATATATYAGLPVWNTVSETYTAPVAAAPGLSYAWKSGVMPSALTPLGPQPLTALPPGAGPRYPVGNPSYDATFTIWQPGIVLGPQVGLSGVSQSAGDGAFVTNFTTWSPDGKFVTVLVAGVALQWPGGTDEGADTARGEPVVQAPSTLFETPARDTALRAVEREVGDDGWALVAWNPDGSLLASISCTAKGASSLELRNTTTGAVVGHANLNLDRTDPGCGASSSGESLGSYANPNLRLLWSPDGARIFLSDQSASSLRIWSVLQG